jgi:radical SAM-linked protein
MRALYQFAKLSRLKFVSHLDLQRFMQMALRRTELPVAYSQGFNPHPVMAFASALAVGWTSECEILDVKLASPVTGDFAFSQMAAALPPDLPLLRVRLVEDTHPAMMAALRMAEYRISLLGVSAPAVAAAIEYYMAEPSVIALRKTKSGEKPADIRAMTMALAKEQTDVGIGQIPQTGVRDCASNLTSVCLAPVGHDLDCTLLRTTLMLTEKATLKPDLLVRTLAERAGVNVPSMQIYRLRLLGEDARGAVDLMDF